jgi:hypothetical protein
MTTPTLPRTLVALLLPRSTPAAITLARAIVQSMTGNASFPTPVPTLAAVSSAIAALDSAQAAVLTRTRGTVEARNDRRVELAILLFALKGYVQSVADADRENAVSLIQSSGMHVSAAAPPRQRAFAAAPGTVSGTVKLEAIAAAKRAAYEWEYSLDGGKTWLVAPVTLQSRTSVSGLQPGASVSFRYRAVTKTGQQDWSQPVSIIVR